MATYKQVDFVTESKQRGGKRENSGRKAKYSEQTAVVRLPLSLIERIKQGNFENVTESNSDLKAKLENEIVTNSNNTTLQAEIEALKAELATAKANNERLVLKHDSEYLRANGLQNQVTELKRQPDKLRAEITLLKHLEHDCQAIKANGERCDRPAKGKVEYHGVLINVCLQHQNQLMKNNKESLLLGNNPALQPEIDQLNAENTRLKESNKRLRAADKDLLKRHDAIYNANERFKKQFEFLSQYLKEQHREDLTQLLDSWFTE
jgi:hypothetical protein